MVYSECVCGIFFSREKPRLSFDLFNAFGMDVPCIARSIEKRLWRVGLKITEERGVALVYMFF